MGTFNRDYLWLCEQPRRSTRLRGLTIVLLIVPVIVSAAWLGFDAQPNRARAVKNQRPTGAASRANPNTDNKNPARSTATESAAGEDASDSAPTKARYGHAKTRAKVSEFGDRVLGTAPAATLSGEATAGWRAVAIRSGDTLSIAFARAGLSYMDSLKIAHLAKYGRHFTRGLRQGQVMQVRADGNGQVEVLDLPVDALHTLEVRRRGADFFARMALVDVQHRRAYADGVIHHSFYADALAAGLTDKQIIALTHIFGWDIDFAQDIRPGDRFAIIYDALYRNGKKIADGPILAAAFVNQGRAIRAIRFAGPDGTPAYYAPDGQPMKKAFIRAPIDYIRVSSPFSFHRMHPIIHRIRRHEGTDYAAPQGTPIHATGAGRIIFRGWRGGYGNMVIIRHDRRLTTRYGHMSAFSKQYHVGSRVTQGAVIGYVGMTGLATGPHVHYEFRFDGKPENPQTVALPRARPLTKAYLARFEQRCAPLLAELNTLGPVALTQAATTSASRTN